MNFLGKFTVTMLGAGLAVGMATAPAQAANYWDRSTDGARGWGSWSRSAQTYTIPYSVKDIDKDGDCAYVVFRPQIYQGKLNLWTSVGWSGYEYKDTVCGYGEKDTGTAVINVWNKMTEIDKLTASKMRMNIRVCEADSFADTCSGFNTPAVDL